MRGGKIDSILHGHYILCLQSGGKLKRIKKREKENGVHLRMFIDLFMNFKADGESTSSLSICEKGHIIKLFLFHI